MHRHRDHRHQRLLWQFTSVIEIVAQRTGAHAEHHVVEFDPEVILDPLEVGERHLRVGDAPVRGDRLVERCSWSPEWGGHCLTAQRSRHPLERHLRGLGQQSRETEWPSGDLESAVGGKADQRRVACGVGQGDFVEFRWFRCESAQLSQQVRGGDAVDTGVVHPEQHRDLAVGQSFDDPHLPQRLAAVERNPGDVRAEIGELLLTTGRRHCHPVHMPLDVEVAVLDPHRVVEIEDRVPDLSTERRQRPDPSFQLVTHLRERITPLHRLGIQLDQPDDVHQLRPRLQIQEGRIKTTQPFHV